jgi:hypothetical protein
MDALRLRFAVIRARWLTQIWAFRWLLLHGNEKPGGVIPAVESLGSGAGETGKNAWEGACRELH